MLFLSFNTLCTFLIVLFTSSVEVLSNPATSPVSPPRPPQFDVSWFVSCNAISGIFAGTAQYEHRGWQDFKFNYYEFEFYQPPEMIADRPHRKRYVANNYVLNWSNNFYSQKILHLQHLLVL